MQAASDHPPFGALLRRARTLRRLSQLDLALQAEVSQRHLSCLESGRSRPSREMVLQIAVALDLSMRERNRLLKNGRPDDAWLAALESQMAENGVAIAAARRETVDRLAQAVDLGISAFPVPELAIEGAVEARVAAGPALAAEDWLRGALAAVVNC